MSTPITYNRFYPKLERVIDVNSFPDAVPNFIKVAVQNSIGQLHYKDLQIRNNPDGSGGNWELSIVAKKLGVELFGSGFELVLNPDLDDTTISSFPLSFNFEWKVLSIIRDLSGLDFSTISTDPSLIFKIALRIFNISETELASQAIHAFVEPLNANTTHIEQFVADINASSSHDLSTVLSSITPNSSLEEVLKDIYSITNEYNSSLVFAKYLLGATLEETKENLDQFFRGIFPYSTIEAYILEVVTPKFEVTLHNLSVGLAFPRNVLTPIDGGNLVEPEPKKSILSFDVGEFSYSLERGFDYREEQAFNLSRSRIGNTPLILEASGIKIDLRDNVNIPEATADGRSDNFKGVFIKEATIGLLLDDDKFPNGTAVSLYSSNLLIGNEGGVSGTVGLSTNFEAVPHYWSSLILDRVAPDITFDESTNKLTIKGGKKTTLGDNTIVPELLPEVAEMDSGGVLHVRDADGIYFSVTLNPDHTLTIAEVTPVSSPLSITFGDNNVISLTNFSVTFRQNEIVASDISGTLEMPGVGDNGTILSISVDISNGFHIIFESQPPLKITDNPIFGLSVDLLQIQDTNDFFQLALGSLSPQKNGATITNNLNIPFADKFLPSSFQLAYLAWKNYKPHYTGNRDDHGLNYDMLLTWKNGLSLPISNIANSSGQISFRKRFEIKKKKENGFFQLDAIELNIATEAPQGLSAAVDFHGATFNFGKAISFTIDGLGLKTTFKEANGNGDIGPFDIDFNVVGPKGIGVSVEAGPVKGTGYLYIDGSEYRGLVQLEIAEQLSITAIAVLNTTMPDGSRGNSFITIVSVTGLNLQLGMGFLLDGLGGILGIHRTMNTQFLRDGLRNGTMESILFPENVAQNLSRIIADIKSVYPMKRDQFLFGPMAKIFWGGVNSIVEADLALLIEFSDPTRILVLGKAGIQIGTDDFNILGLNVAVLIELNFTKKRLLLDASIYDSNLLFFNLEGDIALRIFWGDEKAFLLSVGGFHPDFKPSEHLLVDNIRRLSISLLNGNPSLTIQAYFAVTSNTVQFGAGVDFFFDIEIFALKGGFGFDCLFRFNPFEFTVSIYAYLGIYVGGMELLAIALDGSLKGPTPWSISGRVKFSLLGFSIKARVDKTWGDRINTELPYINILPKVTEALENLENWETRLPDRSYFMVALNDNSKVALDDLGEPALLMNPMSTLTIKQDVVPLDLQLEHYYQQKLSGNSRFAIESIQLGKDSDPDHLVYYDLEGTQIDFAPAQFFNYTEAQRLQKSSFESMKNGVALTASGSMDVGHFVALDYDYDMTLFDGPPAPDPASWTWESSSAPNEVAADFMPVNEFVTGGLIGENTQSKRNQSAANIVDGHVRSTAADFVIVNKNTFAPHNGNMVVFSKDSRSSAENLLQNLMNADPNLEGELMVVQKHEII